MSRHELLLLLLGVALGANLMLGAWVIGNGQTIPVAQGGSVDSGTAYTIATGKFQGKGDGEGLYILKHDDQKLLTFFINGKFLELMHVRDLSKDFQAKVHGEQTPVAEKDKDKK